ncbi:MAG: hypothetical protein NTY98_27795, partial [Verrucomicrobia bacterium]|nr:hypothetical protein [Verrucomicrobiota bacterium]
FSQPAFFAAGWDLRTASEPCNYIVLFFAKKFRSKHPISHFLPIPAPCCAFDPVFMLSAKAALQKRRFVYVNASF